MRLITLFILIASSNCFANCDAASAVAIKFMTEYAQFLNDELQKNTQQSEQAWIESNSLLTNHFKTTRKQILRDAEKRSPGYGLGLNPVLAAQDYPEDGFRLRSCDSDYYIVLEGINWEIFAVTVKAIEQDGKWLVDGSGIINIPKNKQILRK